MARQDYLFTSESVSEGHPDKVCDRISDEIVDLVYREAKKTGMNAWDVRVACETLATTNRVVIAGEVRVPHTLLKKDKDGKPLEGRQRPPGHQPGEVQVGRPQGDPRHRLRAGRLPLEDRQDRRAAARPVGRHRPGRRQCGRQAGRGRRRRPGHHVRLCLPRDAGPDAGADLLQPQDPRSCSPPPATKGEGDVGKLGPDAKSQVTVRYVDGKAAEVTQIVLSTQHLDGSWDSKKVRKVVEPYIREALGDLKIADDCNWYINPTGKFVIGGPDGDAGLTGRKIIVDTYGGAAPHGGGAFSGKDTTKVDRSAAYAARYLAKNVVAAKLADRCTIQLSYAIGVAQPLSVYVDLHGTGKVDEAALEDGAARGDGPVAVRHPPSSRPQQADLRARPPPTAISAARPAATVRSPGRRPTSPRRSRKPSRPERDG